LSPGAHLGHEVNTHIFNILEERLEAARDGLQTCLWDYAIGKSAVEPPLGGNASGFSGMHAC